MKPNLPVIFSSGAGPIAWPDNLSGLEKPIAYLGKNGNLRDFLKVVEDAILNRE